VRSLLDSLKRAKTLRLTGHLLRALVCLYAFAKDDSSAASFSAQGTLTYSLTLEDKARPALARRFDIAVDGCRWTISTELLGSASIKKILDQYDGTNLYSFANFSPGGQNDSASIVEEIEVPCMRTSTGAPQVWLAYASACYFRGLTNNFAIPVYAPDEGTLRASGHKVPVKVLWSEKYPDVIEAIDYFSDGTVYYVSGGQFKKSRFPPPYDNGYLRAKFRTISITNTQGLFVPHSFVYDEYRPSLKAGNTSNDVRLVLSVRGVIDTLHARSAQQQPPPLQRSYVSDLRRASTNAPFGLQYLLTNDGVLPATDTIAYQQALKREARRVKLSEPANQPSFQTTGKWLVRVILVSISVGFVLVFVLGRKQKTTKT
jgi:hypothetical protein